MKLHKIHTLNRKKMILIIGAVALVLLATYTVASIWMWSGYRGIYTDWQSNVKGKLATAMSMPTDSSDQKAKWLMALDSAAELTASPNKCAVSVVYAWQQVVIPSLKQNIAGCHDIQNNMNTLHRALSVTAANIRAEEAIAAILAEPLKSTNVSDAAYQVQTDTWTGVELSLNKTEVPSEVAGVKSAAVLAAGAIKTAWNKLTVANTAQNASQYQTALNELTQAYNSLNNVSSESKRALQITGDAVQKSYDQVF